MEDEQVKVALHGTIQDIGEERHYTDAQTSSNDEIAGYEISKLIGQLYVDYKTQSPFDQWKQVMKALRVHGVDVRLFIDVDKKTSNP